MYTAGDNNNSTNTHTAPSELMNALFLGSPHMTLLYHSLNLCLPSIAPIPNFKQGFFS